MLTKEETLTLNHFKLWGAADVFEYLGQKYIIVGPVAINGSYDYGAFKVNDFNDCVLRFCGCMYHKPSEQEHLRFVQRTIHYAKEKISKLVQEHTPTEEKIEEKTLEGDGLGDLWSTLVERERELDESVDEDIRENSWRDELGPDWAYDGEPRPGTREHDEWEYYHG